MTTRDLVHELIVSLRAGEDEALETVFGPRSPALRDLRRGRDVYELIGTSTGALRRRLIQQLGPEVLEAVQQMHTRYPVTREHAEAYLELARTGRLAGRTGFLIGLHDELVELKRGTPLSRLLESDHLTEQRIHRMIRDGVTAHGVRSPGSALIDTNDHRQLELSVGAERSAGREQIGDALAVLVPANGVVGYRLTRELSSLRRTTTTPLFYIHQGLGSKTEAMRQLVPWRLEGFYSYRELFDATRWVTMRQFDLPRGLQSALREDFIDSIVIALEHDEELQRMLRRHLSVRSFGNEETVRRALRESLPIVGDLPHTRFIDEWRFIPALGSPADELGWAAEEFEAMRRHVHGET